MNGRFHADQVVYHSGHPEYGAGLVIESWKGWYACTVCFAPCSKPNYIDCHLCGATKMLSRKCVRALDEQIEDGMHRCSLCLTPGRPRLSLCPYCNIPKPVIRIEGHHIYEVTFGHETLAVHEHHLRLKPKPAVRAKSYA